MHGVICRSYIILSTLIIMYLTIKTKCQLNKIRLMKKSCLFNLFLTSHDPFNLIYDLRDA